MEYDELAIAIEDLLREGDKEMGEEKKDYFADITDWLSEIGGEYDESDIPWLKSQYEMARF